LYNYIAKLIAATREHELLELGVSPRGTIAITKMARASAYLSGRDYVRPADVEAVFHDVAVHRIKLSSKARVTHVSAQGVLDSILESVPKPTPKRK